MISGKDYKHQIRSWENLWVMGPLKEITVEKITRKIDIALVWRELDEVENLEIIEKTRKKYYRDNFNAPDRIERNDSKKIDW